MTSTILGQTRKPWTTPAYSYIRATDKLPSTDEALALRGDYGDPKALVKDPLCRVRLFNPTGIGTWWIAGFDPETGLATGVAHLFETEAGDFDMNELVAFRGRFGLPIERDLHWHPAPMSAVLAGTVR